MNDLGLVSQKGNDFLISDKESVFMHTSATISLFVVVENTQRKLLVCCRKDDSISLILP